jgi:hypothetical protein
VEANSTGGQGSRRAVAPSDDDDDDDDDDDMQLAPTAPVTCARRVVTSPVIYRLHMMRKHAMFPPIH